MKQDQKPSILSDQDDYLGSLKVDIAARNAKKIILEYISPPIARLQLGKALKAMVLINTLPVLFLKIGDGPCDIAIFYIDESGQQVLCDPNIDASEQIYEYLKSTGELVGQYKGYSIHKMQEDGLTTAVFKLQKEGAKSIRLTLDVGQDEAEILKTISAMIDSILQA